MTKRQTETKYYIKTALIILLKEKRFEDISISDITRRAGINRGTFYLHYKDKYDMMSQFKEEMLSDLYSILKKGDIETDINTILINTFSYVQDNFEYIEAISTISFINFSETIKKFVLDFLLEFPQSKTAIANHYGVPYEYAIQVYLASIESLISYWVATGGKESPVKMTDIISKVLKIDESISQNSPKMNR
ncbi:TetR/AcrR family transcriptional regulator [Streptococcus jiangjianxini]|uniref:TetR/AcrR family transcriptional regulator n=1 Tax=Streptococcus jiangjianxini TaxID=3161189 RepID=UPI0032EBCC5C